MTDLICVALTDLRVGDQIPELNASVTQIKKVKVGRTGRVIRNCIVDLSDGRVLLTTQQMVIRENADGRLVAPWNRVKVESKIGIVRVDPK